MQMWMPRPGGILAASTARAAHFRSNLVEFHGLKCRLWSQVLGQPLMEATRLARANRLTRSGSAEMVLTGREDINGAVTASPPALPQLALAYELVQGALVRWSESRSRGGPPPPTAVLLHGILGGRRNWASFAKRLAQEFPTWQFLLVDLRCHGDSAALQKTAPHTVKAAARDVLQLVAQLKITPRVLIGHSFGGKVALSMVDQAAKPLPRPIRVWVLDATPGRVRAGGDGEDAPAELIDALRRMPPVVASRRAVIEELSSQGFSTAVAQWMTTNLRPVVDSTGSSASGLSWVFDIEGIASMYQSYEDTGFWELVEEVPEGLHIDFLRAERSLHRWAREEVDRIMAAEVVASDGGAGVQLHVLEDAGHWVHADNPDGLFQILAPSFGGSGFLHLTRRGSS